VTGVAHWKRRAFGLVFATPILVCFILMPCANISKTYSMRAHGVSASLAIVRVMVVALVISAALSVEMLRHARASGRGTVE
jgi:predicted branched-subunit amino acid permease